MEGELPTLSLSALHFSTMASHILFSHTLLPLLPLFPDALSALVCVWAVTARGHCLPCLTRGEQSVRVRGGVYVRAHERDTDTIIG